MHELFEAQAARTPDAPAVLSGDDSLSYRELNGRANQLAHYLRELGVGPEVVVAVCLDRSPELVLSLLGVLKAGGAYLPVDPSNPLERTSFMLEDAGAAVVLTRERLAAGLPAHWGRTLLLDAEWGEVAARGAENPPRSAAAAAENLAYVIYTSGSTGRPKGVCVEHRSLTNYVSWAAEFYGVGGLRVSPLHTSAGFDLCVTSLYPALACGAAVRLVAEGGELDGLAEVLRGSEPALVKLTPSHLRALGAGAGESWLGAGHVVVAGGEGLAAHSARWWREGDARGRLVNEYGPTEAAVGCCVHEVEAGVSEAGAEVAIGRPIGNAEMWVLDGGLRPVPAGVAGELYVGGAGLARGYLGSAGLTAERFVPHPYARRVWRAAVPDGRRGEVRGGRGGGVPGARRRAGEGAGLPHRAGRNRGGAGGARRGARVRGGGARGGARERRLVGYVVAAGEVEGAGEATAAGLREHLRRSLPEYMLPSAIVFSNGLPLTANGKVDRRALPSPEGHRGRRMRAMRARR